MTVGYVTVAEVRRFSNVQPTEWSDAAIQEMIDRSTAVIDILTGRTWQGIFTAGSPIPEYYDGDDTDLLWLNQMDIQSIVSLAIDQSGDNSSYTTVTPAYVNFYSEGYIVLNRAKAQVNLFKAGTKTVQISYTYGNATPTDDVKQLCELMVRNLLHFDAERKKEIDQIIQRLKRKSSSLA